jgi:hypothetical protein
MVCEVCGEEGLLRVGGERDRLVLPRSRAVSRQAASGRSLRRGDCGINIDLFGSKRRDIAQFVHPQPARIWLTDGKLVQPHDAGCR